MSITLIYCIDWSIFNSDPKIVLQKLLTKPFLQKDLNCHSGISWFASALEIWGVEIKSGSDFWHKVPMFAWREPGLLQVSTRLHPENGNGSNDWMIFGILTDQNIALWWFLYPRNISWSLSSIICMTYDPLEQKHPFCFELQQQGTFSCWNSRVCILCRCHSWMRWGASTAS